ncbi:MAG: tetratricopeptide repeat protein, partial [Planctomycetales bacterium]|nr:tetratricopeptide repeat protein [Planctomycetales bacterium]
MQLNRPQDAIPYLERAISHGPAVAQYHVNLGSAYSRLKQLDVAASCYRRALELEPNDMDAHRNLGSVLSKQSLFAEAVPHLQHVVTIAPNNRDARLSLAVALQKSGQDEASIPHYEQILAVDPANRRAMVGLAQALLQREEPEERAAELWEKLVESNPDNPAYLNNLATVRKGLKQYEASEEVSRRALGLSANYLPALCNLGIALSCQGRFEEARELFEKALEIAEAPRQAPSADAQDSDRKDRPKLFFNDELPEKTWRELQVVARSQSATLANTFGDLEAVHRHLDHALALDPDDVDCHMMRGFAHLATGEYEPGFREYEWRRKSKHKPR